MKYTLCLAAMFLLTRLQIAAQFNEQMLVGTWAAKKVNVVDAPAVNPPTDPKQLNILRQTFENIVFVLKADKSCNIKMPMIGARIPKGYWTYDSVQAKLEIVNWQNRNTDSTPKMFEMFVKDKDGQTLWVMDEKNFVFELQMEKKN
jgi:hypothetical protein